jgi:hypothetical protein
VTQTPMSQRLPAPHIVLRRGFGRYTFSTGATEIDRVHRGPRCPCLGVGSAALERLVDGLGPAAVNGLGALSAAVPVVVEF